MKLPQIYQYLDYRHYLKDYYEARKATRGSQFSYRSFARDGGFASPNFLKLVMEGQRNLGKEGIGAFIQALKLNKSEGSFFEALVYFNQAKDDQERSKRYEVLSRFKKFREVREIEASQFEYYNNWYHPVVRELTLLPEFKEDPDWIARRLYPPITKEQAAYSLKLLERLGFVARNAQGKLEATERVISTAKEVQNLAVGHFHRHMLEKARDSLSSTPPEWRDISSVTIALSKKGFLEAKRRIQDFRRELNVLLSEEKNPEVIYQLNFQIFNLSRLPWLN
ncbi:MAG: TIGR02147 family protein [Deltaproteobacteria bacterium]|nr:TIGR02147 family protein [Deltaproteobacteria bacterium]